MTAPKPKGPDLFGHTEKWHRTHPTRRNGSWWACEHPDRPVDYKMLVNTRCRPCVLKWSTEAEAIAGHDQIVAALRVPASPEEVQL